MEEQENILKIETFFKDDLKVKELLNRIIPNEMDFFDSESKFEYMDRVLDCLDKIELCINRMMQNYGAPASLVEQFKEKIAELRKYINSRSFYQLLEQGYDAVLKFTHENISNMRPEFVDSIRNGFLGYYCLYGSGVLMPTTINEFLHYIHNFIINNENFYFAIPSVKTFKMDKSKRISLRGKLTNFGNELYEKIIDSKIDAWYIDIINLENYILIMARDLGHASVIEIEIGKDEIFVKYYIPKNNNKDMISALKGISVNKDEFAVGSFSTSQENFVQDICTLMKGIPTDLDRVDLKM